MRAVAPPRRRSRTKCFRLFAVLHARSREPARAGETDALRATEFRGATQQRSNQIGINRRHSVPFCPDLALAPTHPGQAPACPSNQCGKPVRAPAILKGWRMPQVWTLTPRFTADRPICLGDLQSLAGFEVALAPEPVVHGGLQAIKRDTVAGFEQALSYRQGVVEDRLIGEVAHRKVVDPADGTGMSLAVRVDPLDGKFAGKHDLTVKQLSVLSVGGSYDLRTRFGYRFSPATTFASLVCSASTLKTL